MAKINGNKIQLTRPLKIMYWNCDGLERDKLLFGHIIQQKKIDVALLCETKLKPNRNYNFQNYDIYTTDGPNPPHGGTAIVIKKCIPHYQIQIPPLQHLQITALKLQTNQCELCIGALYHSPSHPLIKSDFDKMQQISDKFLFAGDLNCKNTDWNSRLTNKRGRQLAKHAENNNYEVLGPVEHTYYPRNPQNRSDVLDIVLKRCDAHVLYMETTLEFNSDHEPVIMELDLDIQHNIFKPRLYTKTNWSLFRKNLSNLLPSSITIKTKLQLDEEITTLANTIVQEKKHATAIIIPTNNNLRSIVPNLDFLLTQKRKIRRKYRQYHDPQDKTELNAISKHIHQIILDHRLKQLDEDIEEAVAKNNIWPIVKRFKTKSRMHTNAIQGRYGIMYLSKDKANAIADVLQEQFRPNPTQNDTGTKRSHQDIRSTVNNFLTTQSPSNNILITTSELKQYIKQTNCKKAPGPDDITNETLKNLPHVVIKYIAQLMNIALSFNYFPTPWKIAHIITIPKPGKSPILPQNRRPISLLSNLGKIYEKIILSHMKPAIDIVIPDTQFGFMSQRSTTHQLVRVTEYIQSGFNLQEHTTATFLDVEKAFDTVWHTGLLFKLIEFQFPENIIYIIASYLHNRIFQVKVENKFSSPRRISAGVPQGSVLAPLLYNIYTSDLPNHNQCQIAQYADDTVIYYKHFSIINSTNTVQTHLHKLTQWCTKWRVKINEQKSNVIVFTKRRPLLPPPLKMNNKIIPYSLKTKYLGIQLDRRLTWKCHINYIRQKVLQRIHQLYPLLTSPKIKLQKKIQLYRSLILPVILYASPAWGSVAKTHLQRLQVLQNKVGRIITGADYDIRIAQLHEDLNLQYITEEIKQSVRALYHQTRENKNPLISKLGKYSLQNYHHKMPKHILNLHK